MPDLPPPLAAWDARDEAFWNDLSLFCGATGWTARHLGGDDDRHAPYRVEFHLLDAPFAVVHRYAVNDDGMVPVDLETGGPATEPPVIVPLAELPPAHLLETACCPASEPYPKRAQDGSQDYAPAAAASYAHGRHQTAPTSNPHP